MFQVPEPVAATLDVEDVAVVQKAVQNGRGEDLVAGQDLGPVSNALLVVIRMLPRP